MDQVGLSANEHARALRGLGRLNAASFASRQLWQTIRRETGVRPGMRMRVLDIASGGGDIAMGLWRLAARKGVELQIRGLDSSSTACQFAAQRCRPAGPAISFECTDVIQESLPGQFDVVTCSLFLHHLPREHAVCLLRAMSVAGRFVVVSDLRRSLIGYAVAHAACRVMTRSPIVRYDGPQSVANAFTLPEMRQLCAAAGLAEARVRPAWPWRLIVTHQRG